MFKKLIVSLLAVLLISGGVSMAEANSKNSKAVIDNMLERVSVRQYLDKKIEQEKIDTILKAAMSAPSGMNKQPWEILVVDDKEKLAAIAQATPNARYSKDAPLVMIICGDIKVSDKLWMQDCCAVTENILLAVQALDLGAVWCMCYPKQENISAIQKIFNLPENIVPLSIIPMGYPAVKQEAKQKYNPKKIHTNIW